MLTRQENGSGKKEEEEGTKEKIKEIISKERKVVTRRRIKEKWIEGKKRKRKKIRSK